MVYIMSLAYFTDEPVLRPGVVKNCPMLTEEQWLSLMQQKSIAQGRPLTWRQIKDDPELDHEQIALKIGPYASYENRLFCSVRNSVQSSECLRGAAERNYLAAKSVKILRNRQSAAESQALIELQAPENDTALWNPHFIVASIIGSAQSDEWLNLCKLNFIDCLHDFSRSTLKRIFRGESRSYCISRAIVCSDSIEFTVRQINTLSTSSRSIQRIIATVKPGVEAQLLLGVTKRDMEGYDEHVICGCKNNEGKTFINILHSQKAGIA